MANKKKDYDPKQLYGMSVYHDDKHTVYSPFFSKKGYLISENNVKEYFNYIQGYLIALLVFSVAYIIRKELILPVLLALFFLISNIVTFYVSFIKKAGVIENYKKPERDSFAVRQAKSLESKNIWTIIICCPLLAAATMLYSYLNHYEGFMFYMMMLISVFVLLYGFLNIYILVYKKKYIDKH